MFKRLLLYLVAMGILLSVAISAGQWDEGTTLLQEHADQISNYLGQQQTEGFTWLQDHRSALENVLNDRPPADWSTTLDQLAQRDYTYTAAPRRFADFLVQYQSFAGQRPTYKVGGLVKTHVAEYAIG